MSDERLFFAFLPDARTRQHAATAANQLKLQPEVQGVAPEDFHVTLAFIGSVAREQVPTVQKIGSAQSASRFSLRFDDYEYWPKPEVVVAAVRTVPPPLQQLWVDLHRSLALSGLALDAKRLRPHVTLARKVLQPPVLKAMSGFAWPVIQFSLLCSRSGGTRPAYTVVDTWPLLYEPENT